jgi:hypothetical protein
MNSAIQKLEKIVKNNILLKFQFLVVQLMKIALNQKKILD